MLHQLFALINRHEVALGVALVDLSWANDLILGVFNEFIPVSQPAGEAGQSEHDREHLSRDAEGLVDDTRVEVNVGVELALNEVLIAQRNFFELHRDIDHRFTANNCKNIVSKFADESGSWVEVFVNAMAESHEDLLAVLNILDELRDLVDRADLLEHAEDGFVGTTVAGAIEGSDCAGEGCVDIGLRGCHVADSSSRAVELVLSMEDEEDFNGLHDLRMRLEVGVRWVGVHHVQEIFNVAKIRFGGIDWLSNSMAVACSSDCGCASEYTINMLVAFGSSIVYFGSNIGGVGLWVERGHSGDQGAEHSHGVSVMSESSDKFFEVMVVGRVLHDLLCEGSKLLLGWKLSID